MQRAATCQLWSAVLTVSVNALEPGPDDLYVRVVDVGAGHCSVIKMPGDHYMI